LTDCKRTDISASLCRVRDSIMSSKVWFAAGDEIELRAIAGMFGNEDRSTAVSSTKGATGARCWPFQLPAGIHQARDDSQRASLDH
jgi:hypothetical protein